MQKDKNMPNKSKSKHFTPIERKLFLDILQRYKHIIEVKKSDSSTLKDKEVAWSEICNEYNMSQLLSQERTVQQLKKLWTNLKQNQKDALTRERQARMATGGGPQTDTIKIDPDISLIAPDLMKSAPTIYSSNIDEEEAEERKTQELKCVFDDSIELKFFQDDESDECIDEKSPYTSPTSNKENTEPDMIKKKEIDKVYMKNEPLQSSSKQTVTTPSIAEDYMLIKKESRKLEESYEKSPILKRRKHNIHTKDDSENEATLRKERIQKILEQEMEINKIKIEHEKKMSALKEQHLIKMYEQELRTATAAADTAALQLQIKKNENS